MTTSPPRGLGRGLGELFQRTEPARPPAQHASDDDAYRPEPRRSGPEQAGTTDRGEPSNDDIGQPTGDRDSDPGSIGAVPENGGTVQPSDAAGSNVELVPTPAGSSYAELPVGAIVANPRQPRTVFDEDALNELVASIEEVGLLQPIVVRPLDDEAREVEPSARRYELVMGERRWRAAQAAGLDMVPAIVRRTEDHDLLRDALLENLHRAQLNPLEEAAAYQQMLEDFGCTQEELARRIKRSRPQISNTIRLLRLPPTVQRRVAAGVLSAGHARALLVVDDPAAQERLAQRVVAEGLSVRTTEEIVTLGDGEQRPAPRRRSTAPADPAVDEIAQQLSDRLETRVKVDLGRSKGRITIEVASLDDLRRVAEAIKQSSNMSTYN